MSSDDEDGFGGLFAGADEPEPDYPIETLVADRLVLSREGTTNAGFAPLYDRFDCPPTTSTKAAGCHRLDALAPPPLLVKYRNKRHSLWGHRLWNAAKYLTKRMDEGAIDVFDKTVLELGAGLGVPTLSAYRNGARLSVVTDYPDADLMDIIRLNVEENCVPDLMDADVKARYAQMGRPVDNGGGSAAAAAAAPRCIAEPLLWGNRAHIEKVMSYTTGGRGFDVVILSDILFNHVCNDDLADTVSQMMAKTPNAAAYCVFSHHRAFKQLQDFEFFDKCVARGMCYEQIDEEAYPMMFPEDRGPESVRMPVKCYRITHRVDLAGPAVMDALPSQATYDVVIQGTGLTQAYLSAALSRSGVKVLHCDGASVYGGPCQTYTVPQFKAALGHVTADDDEHSQSPRPSLITGRVLQDRTASCFDEQTLRQFAIDVLPSTYMANGETLQTLVEANMVRTVEFQRVARFLFLIPHGAADGGGASSADASLAVREVPLTRGSVFATDMMSVLDKRRLMKFVKDVEASLAEQLHAKTANPADNPHYHGVGSQAEAARDAADAFLAGVAAQTPSCTTLRELLKSKYGVSPAALDVITLLGELDLHDGEVVVKTPAVSASDAAATTTTSDSQAALVQSILLVRQMLTSVGVFNGHTPFLLPCYGASELPQSLCRTSAVWGGQFMLRRSVHCITLEDETERQCAVLSNGQAIRSKVVIVPEEIVDEVPVRLHDWEHAWLRAVSMNRARQQQQQQGEQGQKSTHVGETLCAELPWIIPSAASIPAHDSETTVKPEKTSAVAYARVVVVAKTPLFSWKTLAACGVATARPDVDIEGAPPVLVALLRVTSDGVPAAVACSDDEEANAAVVHVAQHSAGSEQAPEDGASVVVHFTADAHTLSEDALLAFVTRTFLAPDAPSTSTPTAENTRFGWTEPETDVALLASFTLDAHHAAQAGLVPANELVDLPSETWKSHDFALQECYKLTKATRNDRHNLLHDASREGGESDRDAVVPPQAPLTAETLEAELRAQQPTEAMALPDWACVLSVPTLRSHPLYDGQYLEMASRAYALVLAKLGRGEEALPFLQRQPDATA